MSDIFINQPGLKPPTPIEIEGCHGHQVSIAAGGKGHSYGDSCGCDGMNPEAPINFITPILLITALTLIYIKFKINKMRTIKNIFKIL